MAHKTESFGSSLYRHPKFGEMLT